MSMVYRVFIGRYAHLFVCKAVAVDQGEYAIRAWHGCARCRSPHPRSQVLLLPANTWRGSADSPTATRLGYPLEQGACTEAHSSPQQSRCGLAQAVSSGRPRQGRLDKFPPRSWNRLQRAPGRCEALARPKARRGRDVFPGDPLPAMGSLLAPERSTEGGQ